MCRFIETIRIEGGKVWNLSYHNARMNTTRKRGVGQLSRTFFGGYSEARTLAGTDTLPGSIWREHRGGCIYSIYDKAGF